MSEIADLPELLSQIREQFEISSETWTFGEHSIQLYRPSDPESILDDETLIRPYEDLQWQPYWAQAWDASLGMCQYLSEQPLDGLSVLDLGCGIGLTSGLLLSCGAKVTSGDNAPPALPFAVANTWPWRDRVSVQLIDWHETALPERFDVIVGSDIVYDRIEVRPLDKFFRQHLKPGGHVLLSDPNRPMTREYFTTFQELGWQLHESQLQIESVSNTIRIVKMSPA